MQIVLVILCGLVWPRIYSVDQAGPEITERQSPLPPLSMLELKLYTIVSIPMPIIYHKTAKQLKQALKIIKKGSTVDYLIKH